MKHAFYLTFFSSLLFGKSFSQKPDSTVLQKGKDYVEALHEQIMLGTQYLYNGSEYIVYHSVDGEHPYYLQNNPVKGRLKYSGEEFSNIPILLDTEKERLIISNTSYGTAMELVNSLVEEFELGGHQFVNMHSSSSTTLKNGFYEILYRGKTQVLAHRSKRFSEKLYGSKIVRKFDESNSYFLRVGVQFVRINGKRDLLKILTPHKKDLKSYISQNRLFIENREASIVQVVKYFDTLNP